MKLVLGDLIGCERCLLFYLARYIRVESFLKISDNCKVKNAQMNNSRCK